LKSKLSSDPGYFAKSLPERHYELCRKFPLPTIRADLPLIVLPLRVHLVKSPILGCSDSLTANSIQTIVRTMNETYWEPQANIRFGVDVGMDFDLVEECVCPLDTAVQEDLRFFLDHKLRRGPNGKMMHKAERKSRLLGVLLSSMDYKKKNTNNKANNNSNKHPNSNNHNYNRSYDVWFLDTTGHQSQGICIDRKWRTILMGERSTKGYPKATKRPHDCLSKTMAHELGHALGLDHPQGQTFMDGTPLTREREHEHPNLMSGGSDRNGGGGYFLEDWQVSVARESAGEFLRSINKVFKK